MRLAGGIEERNGRNVALVVIYSKVDDGMWHDVRGDKDRVHTILLICTISVTKFCVIFVYQFCIA